jgi:putative ABC transport system ATP-binding protein
MQDKKGAELFREILRLFAELIGGDKALLYLALGYGIVISLFTLAVPISVQLLINTVAHTASQPMILTLALVLLALLGLSGVFTALQSYAMELFERRFYARITADFALRNIYADHRYYESVNRYELTNRYFDIMSVQKIIPSLFIGGFAILLQMVVGIALVSFYHPWLLLFSIGFVCVLWGIWRIWGYRATETAVTLSAAKYETARQLEDIARANSFFKSATHIDHALGRVNTLTNHYLDRREDHFRHSFSQLIALLALYALASAGLLGIGGTLVIANELTLGQLVAAELVLSAVFYGISRLGYYLVQWYDLSAALEEIWRVYHLPLETVTGKELLQARPLPMQFAKTRFTAGSVPITLDLTLQAGQKVLAGCSTHSIQSTILQAVKRYRAPDAGALLLGETNLQDCDPHHLRDRVIVLDRPTIIEATVEEYLRAGAPDALQGDIAEALRLFELEQSISNLPDGLQTKLGVTGQPLTVSEVLRLKLAAAWLTAPHVLILNEFFDTISYLRRQRIFRRLCQMPDMTVLYFSNRQDLDCFDDYLFIDTTAHVWLEDVEALRRYEETTQEGMA